MATMRPYMAAALLQQPSQLVNTYTRSSLHALTYVHISSITYSKVPALRSFCTSLQLSSKMDIVTHAAAATVASISNTTIVNRQPSQESYFYDCDNIVQTNSAASNSISNNHHRHSRQSMVPMHCQAANSHDFNTENSLHHGDNQPHPHLHLHPHPHLHPHLHPHPHPHPHPHQHQHQHQHQHYHNHSQHQQTGHLSEPAPFDSSQQNQIAPSDWCQQTKNTEQATNSSYLNSTFANYVSDTNSSNTINGTQASGGGHMRATSSPAVSYYSSLEDSNHHRVGYYSNHQVEYNYPFYRRNHGIWNHHQQQQYLHHHHHNLPQQQQNLTTVNGDISYHQYNYNYYTDSQQLKQQGGHHLQQQHHDSHQENTHERLAYYQHQHHHYHLEGNHELASRSSYPCATNTVEPYSMSGQTNETENNNSSTVGYQEESLPIVNERSTYYITNNADTIATDSNKSVCHTTDLSYGTTTNCESGPVTSSVSLTLNTSSAENQQIEVEKCSEEEHWPANIEASKKSKQVEQQQQFRLKSIAMKSGNKTNSTSSSSSNSSGSSNRSSSSSGGSSSSSGGGGGGISGNTNKSNSIQRTNQCGVCGRNYARPSTLKTHLRTHTNERPFKCSVCAKTFSQAANLTAHQRVHTGERPFSCPTCGRQFSQSSSVITHLRTHSGERPYRCSMCNRTFSDSSTLTKHCRIHSGEKPYQCDYCPLNFSQSGNLSRHLKLHLMGTNPAINIGSSNQSSIYNNNGAGGVAGCNTVVKSSGPIGNGSDGVGSGAHNGIDDGIGNNITNRGGSSSASNSNSSSSISGGSISCEVNNGIHS